jgi:putative ATP-dependent endonuclease of the OLD family
VPDDGEEQPESRALTIEAIFAFPELAADHSDASQSVPEFFAQMSADDQGQLKLRIVLVAREG